MQKAKINLDTWVQLLGMLGVLGGLVALIIELNQSQRLSRAAAYQTRISEIQEAQRELALSEDLAEILQRFNTEGVSSLSPSEMGRVKAWHSAIQWRMQGQFYQYEQGFLEEAALQRTLDDLANGIYPKWQELGLVDTIHPITWKDKINERLNESDETEKD